MNLKGMQTNQLLAALGAFLAAMILVGPAAARPYDEGGTTVESTSNAIVNQRQLELTADRAEAQPQVIPYLSHGILEPEQAWDVIPYLSQGVLTPSDAARLAAQTPTPDGYQPQLGVRASDFNLGSRADRIDATPQFGGSDFSVVADDGFDLTTTGLATSIFAALFVALAITSIRGLRHGSRSA